jgi:hypothetical protein
MHDAAAAVDEMDLPSKPSSFRLSKAIFDHVERSVAPTSATDRGLKRRARPVSGAAIAFIRSAA